ncbi:hypothetical protein MRB53_018067 [Persea americana]|uniref:Uncharacterized protein n=1 Tax=Persea americana TaxID=3435 RepID=A0ACC2M7K5_PERAE|nr:hypothetical protein MRB53_018067 [Persea americana]
MLMALANTSIRVIVSIPNNELLGAGQSNVIAANWVSRNVVAHVPATNINAVAIGSEVPISFPNAALVLVFALQFIHSTLAVTNLDSQIKGELQPFAVFLVVAASSEGGNGCPTLMAAAEARIESDSYFLFLF